MVDPQNVAIPAPMWDFLKWASAIMAIGIVGWLIKTLTRLDATLNALQITLAKEYVTKEYCQRRIDEGRACSHPSCPYTEV